MRGQAMHPPFAFFSSISSILIVTDRSCTIASLGPNFTGNLAINLYSFSIIRLPNLASKNDCSVLYGLPKLHHGPPRIEIRDPRSTNCPSLSGCGLSLSTPSLAHSLPRWCAIGSPRCAAQMFARMLYYLVPSGPSAVEEALEASTKTIQGMTSVSIPGPTRKLILLASGDKYCSLVHDDM
jgi:hypothetical protein